MLEHGAPKFPATRWSVVLSAAGRGVDARAALEELCRLYWFPLYAFARQHGCNQQDAEDRTQDFLALVAAGDILASATPNRGKLRTYLLAAFERDLIDAHRRTNRQKRGGDVEFLPLEAFHAEERFAHTPLSGSAVATYDRAWAMTCLETVMGALEAEYEERGRAALFQCLRPFLDPEADADYAAAAQAIQLDANAVRQAVFRLRQRFRTILRQTVADTLEAPSEVLIDEELAALRATLTH